MKLKDVIKETRIDVFNFNAYVILFQANKEWGYYKFWANREDGWIIVEKEDKLDIEHILWGYPEALVLHYDNIMVNKYNVSGITELFKHKKLRTIQKREGSLLCLKTVKGGE
ncbi:MAG: hypothetical protein [Podoviridae sp. ctjc_2]|nr:MAG: hypothetical protein [Podoviridae sp. ctjc_2]